MAAVKLWEQPLGRSTKCVMLARLQEVLLCHRMEGNWEALVRALITAHFAIDIPQPLRLSLWITCH